MFSSRSFIVCSFTFRSLIHFELIFMSDVRECSKFILSHVAVINTHFLTRVRTYCNFTQKYTFLYKVLCTCEKLDPGKVVQ